MLSNNPRPANKKQELSDDQRQNIGMRLLMMVRHGELPRGSQAIVARETGVSGSVVSRIWRDATESASIPNHKIPKRNLNDMVNAVKKAYENYPVNKLNRVFLTLQSVLDESLKVDGGNSYTIPHLNKGRLERLENLPLCLDVSDEVVVDYVDI